MGAIEDRQKIKTVDEAHLNFRSVDIIFPLSKQEAESV